MSYTLYTFGGGKTLEYLFNGLSMVLSFSDQGLAGSLLRLVGIISVVWVFAVAMLRQSILPAVHWFVWFLCIVNVLLIPKTSVYISDPLTFQQYRPKIDNVPVAIAVTGSLISEIGKGLTEKLEQVFTLPDYIPYHQTGLVFGSRLMAESRIFRIQDPIFQQNMQRFVQQCVVYDAMIGYKYTLTDLKTTRDIWKLVSEKASPLLGFLYKMPNVEESSIVTCKEGAKRLNANWISEIDQAKRQLGRHFFPQLEEAQARNAFLEKLPQSYRLLSQISLEATEILQQEMMVNAIQGASAAKAYQLGAATHYGSSKAALQQRASYEIAGEMARNALPVMKNVFEAIAYGAFIFIFPLMALPHGYQILSTYLGILVWIQLWAPLYAILNLIMIVTTRYKGMAYVGAQGLTLGTSQGLANLNQDMAALTAWLSFSVPAIAYMMVKGGAASFVHLANHLGGAAQSAIASTGQEVASGNISLSNFSQGTQSLYNTSAFQVKKNAEHLSGQFTHNLGDGAIQVSMAEGRVFSGGSGRTVSSLGTEIWGSNNFSQQLTKASNQELSLMESEGVELSKGISKASRQAVDLFDRVSRSENSGKNYTLDKGSAENKSLSNTLRFSRNLQKTFGVSQQEAMQLALGASLVASWRADFKSPQKGGKKGAKNKAAAKLFKLMPSITIGVNAQGGYSKEAGRRINFEDVRAAAQEQNYNENIESILRATEHQQYGNSEAKDKSLSSALSSSLEKLKSHREHYQVHQQKAERLSQGAQVMQSSSFDTRTNLTQAVLEYIANQPSMDGKSVLGGDKARKILDASSGPLADQKEQYIKAFQEQRTKNVINQLVSEHIKDPTALEAKFKTKKETLNKKSNLEAQYLNDVNELREKAKKEDLDPNAPINSQIKEQVEEMNTQKQGLMQDNATRLKEKYQKAIQEKKKAGEKNLFMNLFRSIEKHNKGGEED